MSTLTDLLADCDALGIRLMPDGDNGLDFDAPQDALTPDLLERLKANKMELLTALTMDLSATPQPCPACGSGVLWRLPNGQVVCECKTEIPQDAERVVHSQLSDGDVWEPHPWDRTEQLATGDGIQLLDPNTLDADGWPKDSIPWPAPGDPWEQETSTTETEIAPGACDKCGCTEYVDVSIHGGRSTRRDCARCWRTHGFPVWHGQRRNIYE